MAAALAIAVLAGAAGEAEPAATSASMAPSWRVPEPDLERGEELAQACLTCHVENSPQVDPPAPKLHHQRQSYLFFALLAYRDGERKSDIMAPFAQGLSDDDARNVAAYLAGEMFDRPPPVGEGQLGYDFTVRECTICHGETGIGEFESMPVLTGQKAEYIAAALAEYRDGRRTNPTMRDVVRTIDPAEFDKAAQYYASLGWLEYNR